MEGSPGFLLGLPACSMLPWEAWLDPALVISEFVFICLFVLFSHVCIFFKYRFICLGVLPANKYV